MKRKEFEKIADKIINKRNGNFIVVEGVRFTPATILKKLDPAGYRVALKEIANELKIEDG